MFFFAVTVKHMAILWGIVNVVQLEVCLLLPILKKKLSKGLKNVAVKLQPTVE